MFNFFLSALSLLFLSPLLPFFLFDLYAQWARQTSVWIVTPLMKQWIEEVCFWSVSPLTNSFFFHPSFFSALFSPFPLCVEAFFPGQGHSLSVLVLLLQWEKTPFHLRLLCIVAYFWYSKDFTHCWMERTGMWICPDLPLFLLQASYMALDKSLYTILPPFSYLWHTDRGSVPQIALKPTEERFLPEPNIVLLKLIENIHV